RGDLVSARRRRTRIDQQARGRFRAFLVVPFAELAILDGAPSVAREIVAERLLELDRAPDIHVYRVGPILAVGLRADAEHLTALDDQTGEEAASIRTSADALLRMMRSLHDDTVARRPFHEPLS